MNRSLKKYIPILDWGLSYKKADFSGDLSAGLTVGVMLIPQGMAYAMLAGLPPIYGLYASTIPIIIYALLGTSRQLAVGPVAMVALLISSSVSTFAEAGSDLYISLAILLALLVGLIQFALGFFRLGFMVNFLSHPVIAGFTSAAAVIIGFSQLKHLLGLRLARGKVHETIIAIGEQLNDIHLATFLIGIGAIVVLKLVKRIDKRIPGPLLTVLAGMAVVFFMKLNTKGVAIVGDVPGGFPSFIVPDVKLSMVQQLLPMALTISFIGFMESIAVAKAIQAKHKNYKIEPNQELIALGLANVVGSFFKAFPVTGGFSRTAVNDQAGAKTGLASIISAVLIVITLLFFTTYFYYLPTAVLAAIIIVAVIGLIDIKEARHLWKTDKRDFTLFATTAIGTLVLGIEEGIIIGVVLSLAAVVYHASYPHIAKLGRIPGSAQYRNINRYSDLELNDETLIFRFDAQLYFANCKVFTDYITENLLKNPEIKHIIIHGGSISDIDSSALHMLSDLIDDLQKDGVTLYFAAMTGPVRDILSRNDVVDKLGAHRFFLNVHDAVQYIETGKISDLHHRSLQTNFKA